MVTLPAHDATLRVLMALAEDPTASPERRAAARGAARELIEHRQAAGIVSAARVVAAAWGDPRLQADAAMAYWDQLVRQEPGSGRRRASMMVALDALRLHVLEADKAAAERLGVPGPSATPPPPRLA